jgi:hypothetical protein
MYDNELWEKWEKCREKAEIELKDLPVKVSTGHKGFSGAKPIVFIHVAVKGNKELMNKLKILGWNSYHSNNVQGVRIAEFQKIFNS